MEVVRGNEVRRPARRHTACLLSDVFCATWQAWSFEVQNLRREFLIALALCLIIILLIIVTTDSAPQWIYQGF